MKLVLSYGTIFFILNKSYSLMALIIWVTNTHIIIIFCAFKNTIIQNITIIR